jgi:hypothetical protein
MENGAANIASQLRKPSNIVPTTGLANEMKPRETIAALESIESGTGNTDSQ